MRTVSLVTLTYQILGLVGMAGMFHKAGRGWGWALVPIVNFVKFMRMIGMSLWWVVALILAYVVAIAAAVGGGSFLVFLLLFVPVVLSYWIVQAIATSRAFGTGGWYAVGVFFASPIFFMILGFGDHEYAYGGRRGTRPWDRGAAQPRGGPQPVGSGGSGWSGPPGGAGGYGTTYAPVAPAGMATTAPTGPPTIGWNPDPDRPGDRIYWDGNAWTSRVTWDGQQWVTTWQR